MGNPNWGKKLKDSLDEFVGEEVRQEIMAGSEALTDSHEKIRTEWVRQMLSRMDRLVPDEDKRYDIMARCSCDCALPLLGTFREEYRKNKDIDALLEMMYKNPFYVRPRRDGNILYFTKVACHAEECEKAETPELKRYHYCHCDYARAAELPISSTHCFCSAGWYRGIWEGILKKPVKVKLLKSVLQGDDFCEFAVYI